MSFFRGFKTGLSLFGQNITIIVNTILLFFAYFMGIGITALFAKMKGKTFLDLKVSKTQKTYWKDLNLEKKPIEKYYRQF